MGAKKKPPTPLLVVSTPPITESRIMRRVYDPLAACNVCGKPAETLIAWRECDEHDKPIAGVGALVYIGADHTDCDKALADHPRLYSETRGEPGAFPLLCGPCVHRRALACLHLSLKVNGGDGLKIMLHSPNGLAGVIICSRGRGGGCWTPPQVAKECEGRSTLRLVQNDETTGGTP